MAPKIKTTIAGPFQAHKRAKVYSSEHNNSHLESPKAFNRQEGSKDPCLIPDPEDQASIQPSLKSNVEESISKFTPENSCGNTGLCKSTSTGALSREQMELNKSIANAIRNVKACEDKVAEARGQGIPYPDFKNLLIDQSWLEILSPELKKPYVERLYCLIKEEAVSGAPIYPPPAKVFNAFNACPFEKVKVVILGQDPYHGPGQAMGLCFSVEKGVKFPPSLLNIFKEIQDDLGCCIPPHGNLEKWSYQGVLLLNTVLTVRGGKANSHSKKGWEEFTDAAIKAVAQRRSGVVFLLWGNSAQGKIRLINQNSHHILKAAHPSGLSAHKGFFKCRHFSQTNKLLEEQGLLPIDWQI